MYKYMIFIYNHNGPCVKNTKNNREKNLICYEKHKIWINTSYFFLK